MRKHGWQLPYHPLQVVAIAVFLALGFAFYVFFLPFVGKKVFEYVVMGIYTPLVTCVFCLYVWCASTNPGDSGVFKSRKFPKVKGNEKDCDFKDSREDGSTNGAHGAATGNKILDDDTKMDAIDKRPSQTIQSGQSFLLDLSDRFPLSFLSGWCCPLPSSHEQKTSEDGMFYCSICEVEVGKYSKHCRVCDKCVDHFDHHCRWLNNCIGRKNYGRFFVLMLSALLLLILQWSIGVLVLVLCFLERKRYTREIMSKLGSSFSLVPFIVVVASCTFLAMLATLPLAQLFFFHVLLIKKGISTYDYIVALREQEQQAVGQQSPQMSSGSSLTGFSSASSFRSFQRGAWCTPPRLFLEDQFDVIPQEINMAVNSGVKKMMSDETKKASAVNIKINPWALARMNAEEVSKAAALARKKSKVLQPVVKQVSARQEIDALSGDGNMGSKPDTRRRAGRRGSRLPMELPLEPLAKISASGTDSNSSYLASEASSSLAPLQLEARCAFRPSRTTAGVVLASSPDSSLDSPDLHPFRVSSSGADDSREQSVSLPSVSGHAAAAATASGHKGAEFSRSISDGYDASGGEDSDRVPSRIVHRSLNWSSIMLGKPMSGHSG